MSDGDREPGIDRSDPDVRVAFVTLGCKVNQYDTATMETLLRRDGYRVVPFTEGADVCVVNTCAVTDRADAESRRLARRAKRLNPASRVIMTGCFAQTSTETVAKLAEVDYVVGVGRLPDLLRAVRGELAVSEGRVFVDDLRKSDPFTALGADTFGDRSRAFLKVQEGCDLFCTFCIVPFARGRSRSIEPRRVLTEMARLADRGFQEIVLTGIHLGGYGRDLATRLELADLVEMVAEVAPVPRVRLSSIDPPEVTPRLLELLRRSEVLCPHLHMPIQSGADPVLRRMRRQYDRAQLLDVLAEIERALPEAGLGTDVIAGFPGETDVDFEASLDLISGAGFTYLHVFPYSRRSGTTAAKASDPLPRKTVAARARALRRVGTAARRDFVERFVGHDLRVLVERTPDRETGLPLGYSRNYVRVLVPGAESAAGREVRVRLTRRIGDRAEGVATASPAGEVEIRVGA